MKAGKAIFSEVSRVTRVLPQCARGHWSIKLASTSPSIKIIQRVFNKAIALPFLSSFHAVLTKPLSSDVSLSGYTPARRNEAFQLSITSWFSPASSNALWSLNKFLKKKTIKQLLATHEATVLRKLQRSFELCRQVKHHQKHFTLGDALHPTTAVL